MTASDLAGLRTASLLVGAVALASVLLQAASYALIEFVVFPGLLGPPDSAAAELAFETSAVLGSAASRVVPLLAVAVAFSLTAVRDLPTAPCLAGALLGGLVAVLGQPLALGLLVDSPAFLLEPLVREGIRWTGRFVVPVLAAVLLGSVLDDLRERGARWRGAAS